VEQPAVDDGVEAQAQIPQAQRVGDLEPGLTNLAACGGGNPAGSRLTAGLLEGQR
jgi:hypothetical protein